MKSCFSQEKPDVNSMLSSMLHRECFKTIMCYSEPNIEIGTVCMEPQAECSADRFGSHFIMVDGELFNRNMIQEEYGLEGNSNEEFFKSITESKRKKEILRQIDGNFIVIIYDIKNQIIELITDKYGLKQVYWFADKNQLACSSEIKALRTIANVRTDINEASVNYFLKNGHMANNDTWFKNIFLMPAATICSYSYHSAEIQFEEYWSIENLKQLTNYSVDDIVTQSASFVSKAVEKRIASLVQELL